MRSSCIGSPVGSVRLIRLRRSVVGLRIVSLRCACEKRRPTSAIRGGARLRVKRFWRVIRWRHGTRLRLAAKRPVCVELKRAAAVIVLDPLDDLLGSNQVEAAGDAQVGFDLDGIDEQVVVVFHVAVADWLAPRFPG